MHVRYNMSTIIWHKTLILNWLLSSSTELIGDMNKSYILQLLNESYILDTCISKCDFYHPTYFPLIFFRFQQFLEFEFCKKRPKSESDIVKNIVSSLKFIQWHLFILGQMVKTTQWFIFMKICLVYISEKVLMGHYLS